MADDFYEGDGVGLQNNLPVLEVDVQRVPTRFPANGVELNLVIGCATEELLDASDTGGSGVDLHADRRGDGESGILKHGIH